MIDISSARINRMVVHRVGNKYRSEGMHISENEAAPTEIVKGLVLRNYLAPTVLKGNCFNFYHETNLELNAIYHYSRAIFESNSRFAEYSSSIAKHLYSASVHPNIGGGDFIIIIFDDIRGASGPEQGLGLFRVEGRTDYLDTIESDGSIKLIEKSGISLERIHKGAVILSKSKALYAVDSLGSKTKYWIDGFLKATPAATSRSLAKVASSVVRKVSNAISDPEKEILFAKDIYADVMGGKGTSINTIRAIASEYIGPERLSSIIEDTHHDLRDTSFMDLEIDKEIIQKHTRKQRSSLKISDDIVLTLTGSETRIDYASINVTSSGFRVSLDISNIRKYK
ncbi:nucleoid-associated protein [Azospirillum largimobile]